MPRRWNFQHHGHWVPLESEESHTRSVIDHVKIVSFNFGVDQQMLTSKKRWPEYERHLRGLLQRFRCSASNISDDGAFIFGCELGGHLKGMTAANVDFAKIVRQAFRDAKSETHGAYAVVYPRSAQLIEEGNFDPTGTTASVMRYTIFLITIRGDSQPAGVPAYLIVGNLHIRTPSKGKVPPKETRRNWTKLCLNHLASLGQEYGDQTPVARILCGDVNLCQQDAMAAVRGCNRPCSGLASSRRLCWDICSTEVKLSGDILFVSGAVAEEYPIAVGDSYTHKGIRPDKHDAVAIRLSFPQSGVPDMASPGDDSAVAASSRANGSASQPAATRSASPAPSQTDGSEPDYGGDEESKAGDGRDEEREDNDDRNGTDEVPEASDSEDDTDFPQEVERPDADAQVQNMHDRMLHAEATDELGTHVSFHLSKLLYQKRTMVVDGSRRKYVASSLEVKRTLKWLLRIRREFLTKKGLADDHMLNNEERAELMKGWKEWFHAQTDQLKLQMADSKKPPPKGKGKGKGKGKDKSTFKGYHMPQKRGKQLPEGWGNNIPAWRAGMHSRFHRHLQISGGTKQIAEMIVFTGRYDIATLQRLQNSSASKPAEALHKRIDNRGLKRQKQEAALTLRYARMLASQEEMGEYLNGYEKRIVKQYKDGTLQETVNVAVLRFGHGTLRDPHSTHSQRIGGSTCGVASSVLDDRVQPDTETLWKRFCPHGAGPR